MPTVFRLHQSKAFLGPHLCAVFSCTVPIAALHERRLLLFWAELFTVCEDKPFWGQMQASHLLFMHSLP